MAKKRSGPDPDAAYIALDSFATQDAVVRRGTRLRGDDPLVEQNPLMFVEDALSNEEQERVRRERLSPEPEVRDDRMIKIVERLREEDAVEATTTFLVNAAMDGSAIAINRGDRLHRDDWIVRRWPERFKPAGK